MRFIPILLLLSFSIVAFAQKTAIRTKMLIDGTGRQLPDAVIVVEGERIVAVGGKELISSGLKVIDWSAYTVLPGFIDMHIHPLNDGRDDYQGYHMRKSSADKALQGLHNMQGLLHNGWTTIRIPGDLDVGYAHFAVRDAINRGQFDGPRIYGAGHWISVTGGGGDINFLSYEQSGVIADGLVVNGEDEMRKAVRNEIKYGSDWIKLLVTGAFMTAGDNPNNVHFSQAELAAAVDEATRRDVPVMAHAHSAEGIKMSVRAGARTIEHGSFLDDEAIELMRAKGTYLIPTLSVGKWFLDVNAESEALAKAIQITKKYRTQVETMLTKAIKAGVKVGVGSDMLGGDPSFGNNEFVELVRLGMTPMQAIMAGTRVNAEALGKLKDLGTVESGKYADLVAVAGDPLKDISEMKRVKAVIKGGKLIP